MLSAPTPARGLAAGLVACVLLVAYFGFQMYAAMDDQSAGDRGSNVGSVRGDSAVAAGVAAAAAAADSLTPQMATFDNVDVAWLVPPLPNLSDARSMKHVLLLFHGCTHKGLDWFTFPEERIVVQAALRLGVAVVAFTSQDRWSGCWDSSFPPLENPEAVGISGVLPKVAATLQAQAARVGWGWNPKEVKYLALGGSSGGTFVTLLPTLIPLHAIALYISPGHPEAMTVTDPASVCKSSTRNVVFLYMPRDKQWASTEAVEAGTAALRSSECGGGKTVTSFQALPRPVTAALLTDRVPFFRSRPELSQAIVLKLSSISALDPSSLLVSDPRQLPLSDLVGSTCPHDTPVEAVTSALQEVLNMCYAKHEYTSEHVAGVLAALIAP